MKRLAKAFLWPSNYQCLGSTNKEDMKRKREELFLNRVEQLMGNYIQNSFSNLEYKFTNEEIREETDESFLYQSVAYRCGYWKW